ncbi:hypothetical protein GGR95_001603 [Sulfitobacter undariae]|uniref:Peptidase inhibitor I78 family protein n=1 Tax=Sulfitobacter undariae TaxID=1563671 RepID=A0A7W6E796_9RHOB|nr:hypothetical protein [Sulfitobacter undariae]MBB3993972.1 hypothetical protein [Sulfitobacter undariae]
MVYFMRPALLLCTVVMALSACDPTEFDKDPDVRRDARANRTCIKAVSDKAGSPAQANTSLPVVEINQYVIDVPTGQQRWMCRTDDEGNATQLYKMGQG